jgi:hypothetical protein
MPYTPAQIGSTDLRPWSKQTKDRLSLVLIQHGRAPGHDETQIVLVSPCGWNKGRRKTLELLSAGVDLNDIRFVQVPSEYSGDAEAAGNGLRLRPATDALWWATDDDRRAKGNEMDRQQYAAHLLAKRGP